MSSIPELLHATLAAGNMQAAKLDSATQVANRVLCKHGMSDYETAKDHATYWKEYIVFRYYYIANPSLATGGGAILAVRTSDMLGGMVYCSHDWLEQDIDVIYENIPIAFSMTAKPCQTTSNNNIMKCIRIGLPGNDQLATQSA